MHRVIFLPKIREFVAPPPSRRHTAKQADPGIPTTAPGVEQASAEAEGVAQDCLLLGDGLQALRRVTIGLGVKDPTERSEGGSPHLYPKSS